ncbi:MAG: type II secretion system GspH family protein [Verrucomicrobiales bacterium]|nr:type II secretion system GspH family protein [Verrucomicrobiales bacterium]
MTSSPVTTKADRGTGNAFSMIEMLIVIAVIGIMSALVISAFSNAAEDTRRVIARQQQAAVQSAVNAWVNSVSQEHGLAEARRRYNLAGSSKGRLQLVGAYLDESSLNHFLSPSNTVNANEVRSAALRKLGQHLSLNTWSAASYPKVEIN